MKSQRELERDSTQYDDLVTYDGVEFPENIAFYECPSCKERIELYMITDCPDCGFSLLELKSKLLLEWNQTAAHQRPCFICETVYNHSKNEFCPKCLYPLPIYRNGKRISEEDIANGKIRPAEAEIKIAKKRSEKGTYANMFDYSIDDKGEVVTRAKEPKQSKEDKLRSEVAVLRAETAKAKNTKKVPWFLAGFVAADAARKTGLTGNPAGGNSGGKMCPKCRRSHEPTALFCNQCGQKM
jgi:hypothetical protein